ncbi:hypothetical protein [Lichenibacterium dinghuense]|uniref:hypothetical protein n=1 Tax=Lichenibacterium dinghuense TaxID=2895977 RepID=UPI001F1F0E1A|nr:hypothetical protein [Lichenibacterium sp. 6Y81]
MFNLRKIFLSIAVVSTIATQNRSSTQSKVFTDVYFGNVRYHLPVQTYRMWVQKYDAMKDRAAFGFSVIAPNIDPASSDPNESVNWGRGTGWHKEVHILFEYGHSLVTAQQSFEHAIKDSLQMKEFQDARERNGERRGGFKYLDPDRFELMQNGCKKYQGYAIAGNESLMCPTEDGLVYVACHPEKGMPLPNGGFWKWSPYCAVNVNVGERAALQYAFSEDYIDDFPQMHHRLINLLKSFQVSSSIK